MKESVLYLSQGILAVLIWYIVCCSQYLHLDIYMVFYKGDTYWWMPSRQC